MERVALRVLPGLAPAPVRAPQKLHAFFKAANALYLAESPLWEQDDSWQGFQWLCADDNKADTVAFLRWDREGKPLIVVCNFSPVHRKGYYVGAPFAGTWAPIFNTDAEEFGGSGLGDTAPLKTVNTPCHDQEQALSIDLPPMSAVIYRCTRRNPVRKKKDSSKEAAEKKTSSKAKKGGGGRKIRRRQDGRPEVQGRGPARPQGQIGNLNPACTCPSGGVYTTSEVNDI